MRHPTRSLVVLVLCGAAALAGCGSKSTSAPASPGTSPPGGSGHIAVPVGNNPSKSAKMICDKEVQEELEQLVGVKTTAPVVGKWSDHIYSCRYVYANGVMKLSVKELADPAETDKYFASRETELGKTEQVPGLGLAFTTKNLSVVVRKDYKVMTIDISGLPAQFGIPPDSRGNVAINAAATIMDCWTGA